MKPFVWLCCLGNKHVTKHFNMKKTLLLILVMMGCVTVSAQKIAKNELKQLQSFLAMTSEKGVTNAQVLQIPDMRNPSLWKGVTIENNHVTAIDWKHKNIAGALDLSGFAALKTVDVSHNKLTSISLAGCGALGDFNASRNALTSVDFTGCESLSKINVSGNRLTELTLADVAEIKNINCSNNLFVDLNVSGAMKLETLNCQDCHLQNLRIDGCTALKNLFCG